MRTYYIILAALIAVFFTAVAQGQPNRVIQQQEKYITVQFRGGVGADSMLGVPIKDTTVYFPAADYKRLVQLVFRPQDSTLYYYTGKYWKAVGGSNGDGVVVTWDNLPGKPTTFPASPHTHTPDQVIGLESTYARIDSLNAKDQRVNARIDALPSGAGSGSGDSLVKALQPTQRNSDIHLARVATISAKDSVLGIPLASGTNELDFAPESSTRGLLAYDFGNGVSMTWGTRSQSGALSFPFRTPQQYISKVWDTPQGDSVLFPGGNPALRPDGSSTGAGDQPHYGSIFWDPKDSLYYAYTYYFGGGTTVRRGRWIKDIRQDTGRFVVSTLNERFNDAHVRPNPKGGYTMVAHSIDRAGLHIWWSASPYGPFTRIATLDPATLDPYNLTPGMEQSADPEVHFDGDRAYLMAVSHIGFKTLPDGSRVFTYPRIRSVKWIWEITNDITPGSNVRFKGKPVVINTYDYSNPVFVRWVDDYIFYSRAASCFPNIEDVTLVDAEAANAQLGRFVVSKLTDKTKLDYARDENSVLQARAGVPVEISGNRAMVKSGNGNLINDANSIRVLSGVAGIWGPLNFYYFKNFEINLDFTIDQAPPAGQIAYITRLSCDTPTQNRAAVSLIVNSDANVAVRYDYQDGTSQTSVAIAGAIGKRLKISYVNNYGQYLTDGLGAVNTSFPDPFGPFGARPTFYSLFNRATDSIAPAGQFYGRIYSATIKRFADDEVAFTREGTYSLAPNMRKILMDPSNVGAQTVYLPADDGSGNAFTGKTFDDYYQITQFSGGSVQIRATTGNELLTTLSSANQTAIFRYTRQGYQMIAGPQAAQTGFTGTQAGITFANGRAVSADGTEYYTKAQTDSQIATAIQVFAESLKPDTNTYDADALILIDSMDNYDPVPQSLKLAISNAIKAEKDSGIWANQRAVYLMAGSTATSQSWNAKNPAQFRLQYSGTHTHSAQGMFGGGSTQYVVANNGHNASHSLGFSYYSGTDNLSSGYEAGESNTSSNFIILSYSGGATFAQTFGETVSTTPPAGTTGMRDFSRIGANLYFLKNGVQFYSVNNLNPTATTTETLPIQLNSVINEPSTKQCRFFSIYENLTPAQLRAQYNIIQAWQTSQNRQL